MNKFGILAITTASLSVSLLALSIVNASLDIAQLIRPAQDFTIPEPGENYPGGATTAVKSINRNSFSHASANMPFERELNFKVGNGIFRKVWVSAPSSTKSSDGLGPLFNARSCQRCHLKDGRGRPPQPDEAAVSMFLRLSIPPQTLDELASLRAHKQLVIPDPTYGTQLQNYSIQGHLAEGQMDIQYEEKTVAFEDGSTISLRMPIYSLKQLNYGEPHPNLQLSPRVAPPMIGVGLLEAIDEADILNNADPNDENRDGISGKANMVWDEKLRATSLGRFGWKAGQPTIEQQVAGAFLGDLGLSSPLIPSHSGDCTANQKNCIEAIHGVIGDSFEVTQEMFDLVVFYSKNLAVPSRRDVSDSTVLQGKRLFYESNCISCHIPKYVTKNDPVNIEQSKQLIWPYTDLLLHDMGEGLADNRPEGEASGREWRTPPLWGIGLTEIVNGHTYFLHDGRARNLMEAVLWHGGEAEASKQRVLKMSKTEREALIRFLESL